MFPISNFQTWNIKISSFQTSANFFKLSTSKFLKFKFTELQSSIFSKLQLYQNSTFGPNLLLGRTSFLANLVLGAYCIRICRGSLRCCWRYDIRISCCSWLRRQRHLGHLWLYRSFATVVLREERVIDEVNKWAMLQIVHIGHLTKKAHGRARSHTTNKMD